MEQLTLIKSIFIAICWGCWLLLLFSPLLGFKFTGDTLALSISFSALTLSLAYLLK